MPVFSLTRQELRPLTPTTFAEAGLSERGDLQRLLREQIDAVLPNEKILVIAEEFGDWEDSRRRIDPLGVDQAGNLVVVELKRADDGGPMESQALRYAAMVSKMTFDRAVGTYEKYLGGISAVADARQKLLEHLGWDEPKEDQFAQDVRIVLAAANFSRELTTAVLWLNERDLRICCVRMSPFADGDRLMLEIQQVIPLPDAEEYQVRLREKEQVERAARRDRSEGEELLLRFWRTLLEYSAPLTPLHLGRSPSADHTLGQPANAPVPGVYLRYVLGKGHARIVLALYGPRGKSAFEQLALSKPDIETMFGGELDRERRDGAPFSRIVQRMPSAEVRNEAAWPELIRNLVETMIRFEAAFRPHLDRLTV